MGHTIHWAVPGLRSLTPLPPQIRTLCYGCQLAGGVLARKSPAESEMGRRLLTVSAQLSHCRTVLRLFDDLAMLAYSRQYGLGAKVTSAFLPQAWARGSLPPFSPAIRDRPGALCSATSKGPILQNAALSPRC